MAFTARGITQSVMLLNVCMWESVLFYMVVFSFYIQNQNKHLNIMS